MLVPKPPDQPIVRTVKVWPEGTDAVFQDQFINTDLNMLIHTDLDQYASSVLDSWQEC